MTSKEIDNAMLGVDQVEKIYLGQDLVWENGPNYWSMPLTFNVLSGGTITFRKVIGQGYTADTCAFQPYLNGVNIAPYHPGAGTNVWVTDSTSAYTVNVQEGDVFEIYGFPMNGFQTLGKGPAVGGSNTSYHTFSGSTAVMSVCGNLMSMCVSLNDIQTHNFTTFKDAADWGMATDISYTVAGLLRGLPGLVSAENLWLPLDSPNLCYLNLFKGDSSLASVPSLPSATAGTLSYAQMFENCTSLNHIKCLLTNVPNDCTTRWVNGVSATGTFVKKAGVTWPTGNSGIPSGWTVIEE